MAARLLSLLPLLPLLAVLAGGCGEPEVTAPDLLLVTVDSLRADFLGCYGGDETVGVQICEIGKEGLHYAWAFSPSSSSAPSIASLLTSTYPSAHRVDASAATFLHDDATTLAEALRHAGYATGAFIGSPELNRSRNLQQGFDVFDDHMQSSATGGLPVRSAQETTDAAIAWVRSTPAPRFLWLHYREPHGPYDSPARPDGNAEPDAAATRPGERLRVLATATGRGGIPGYQAIPGLFTRQGYEGRYRAEIRSVDAQLARLIAEIEPQRERIGILVTADHGEAFGEDRWYLSHGHSLALDQIRVPLLWRPPGGAAPERIREPVSTLDVAPTLVQAAGLPVPERFEGEVLPRSGAPTGEPNEPQPKRVLFAEHPDYVAVVSGDFFYSRLRGADVFAADPTLANDALRTSAARTARLKSGDGALPGYDRATIGGPALLLEPLLAEFLARSESRGPTPSEPPIDASSERSGEPQNASPPAESSTPDEPDTPSMPEAPGTPETSRSPSTPEMSEAKTPEKPQQTVE